MPIELVKDLTGTWKFESKLICIAWNEQEKINCLEVVNDNLVHYEIRSCLSKEVAIQQAIEIQKELFLTKNKIEECKKEVQRIKTLAKKTGLPTKEILIEKARMCLPKRRRPKKLITGDRWKCVNPFGFCLYDPSNNHTELLCVFCGEPEERK
jgi:hypothetical protein